MLNQQTINKLHELRLTGMAESFADQLKQPDMERLSFEERFGLIVDRQWTWKENNRMERYLKNARMKLAAVAPHDKLTEGATFLARCFV